MCILQLLLCF